MERRDSGGWKQGKVEKMCQAHLQGHVARPDGGRSKQSYQDYTIEYHKYHSTPLIHRHGRDARGILYIPRPHPQECPAASPSDYFVPCNPFPARSICNPGKHLRVHLPPTLQLTPFPQLAPLASQHHTSEYNRQKFGIQGKFPTQI